MSLPLTTPYSVVRGACVPNTHSDRGITEEQKKTIFSVFQKCDDGHKGFLTREDVKMAVVSLFGYKPSKYEVNEMLSNTCLQSEDGSVQGLTLEAFLGIMSSKMAVLDEDEEIRQTFLAFDLQCRGFVTVDDLRRVFSQVAPHLQSSKVETAFREIDRDGDGRVSYKDFEFMMKYSVDDGF